MICDDYNYNKDENLNTCPICGSKFNEGDPVTVIEWPKGPFLIVHKACAEKASLVDHFKRNYDSKTKILKNEDKLWRYMDLAKFISMIKDSSLYFSSPSEFHDLYEGAHGELKNKQVWDDFYLSFSRAAIITAPDNCWHKIEPEELKENAETLVTQISRRCEKGVFINCWHFSEVESEAMWKVYSTNVKNAIAIQTSYGDLKKELGEKATIRPINYVDYSKQFVGLNEEFWCKRKSFEYEKEVRAIVYDYENKQLPGIKIKVDLNKIIKNVFISPYSPGWFYEIIDDLIRRYNYEFNLSSSSMVEPSF